MTKPNAHDNPKGGAKSKTTLSTLLKKILDLLEDEKFGLEEIKDELRDIEKDIRAIEKDIRDIKKKIRQI